MDKYMYRSVEIGYRWINKSIDGRNWIDRRLIEVQMGRNWKDILPNVCPSSLLSSDLPWKNIYIKFRRKKLTVVIHFYCCKSFNCRICAF